MLSAEVVQERAVQLFPLKCSVVDQNSVIGRFKGSLDIKTVLLPCLFIYNILASVLRGWNFNIPETNLARLAFSITRVLSTCNNTLTRKQLRFLNQCRF
jgi:hypothetical protein